MKPHTRPPGGQLHQGGGQGFPQRSLAVPGAVATAVQRIAGGIQGDAGHIVVQAYINGINSSRFGEGFLMGAAAEPFNHGLLGNGLTVPDAHELAAGALAADVHLGIPRQDGFPRNALHQLKKLFKGTDFLLRKDDQHPIGTAEHQICTEGIQQGTFEPCTADFGLHVRHFQPAQLIGYNAFQSEGSRCKQGQCIRKHNFTPLVSPYDTAFQMLCKAKRKSMDCMHCIRALYTTHTIH